GLTRGGDRHVAAPRQGGRERHRGGRGGPGPAGRGVGAVGRALRGLRHRGGGDAAAPGAPGGQGGGRVGPHVRLRGRVVPPDGRGSGRRSSSGGRPGGRSPFI